MATSRHSALALFLLTFTTAQCSVNDNDLRIVTKEGTSIAVPIDVAKRCLPSTYAFYKRTNLTTIQWIETYQWAAENLIETACTLYHHWSSGATEEECTSELTKKEVDLPPAFMAAVDRHVTGGMDAFLYLLGFSSSEEESDDSDDEKKEKEKEPFDTIPSDEEITSSSAGPTADRQDERKGKKKASSKKQFGADKLPKLLRSISLLMMSGPSTKHGIVIQPKHGKAFCVSRHVLDAVFPTLSVTLEFDDAKTVELSDAHGSLMSALFDAANDLYGMWLEREDTKACVESLATMDLGEMVDNQALLALADRYTRGGSPSSYDEDTKENCLQRSELPRVFLEGLAERVARSTKTTPLVAKALIEKRLKLDRAKALLIEKFELDHGELHEALRFEPDEHLVGYTLSELEDEGILEFIAPEELNCLNLTSLAGIEPKLYAWRIDLEPEIEEGGFTLIDLSHNKLSSISELEYCGYLGELIVHHNNLGSIDLMPFERLQILDISHNKVDKFITVDATERSQANDNSTDSASADEAPDDEKDSEKSDIKVHSLSILKAHDNKLESIDLGSLPDLIELDLSGNKLKSIDLTSNSKLIRLNVARNKLTSLDCSACPNIKEVIAAENPLMAYPILPPNHKVVVLAVTPNLTGSGGAPKGIRLLVGPLVMHPKTAGYTPFHLALDIDDRTPAKPLPHLRDIVDYIQANRTCTFLLRSEKGKPKSDAKESTHEVYDIVDMVLYVRKGPIIDDLVEAKEKGKEEYEKLKRETFTPCCNFKDTDLEGWVEPDVLKQCGLYWEDTEDYVGMRGVSNNNNDDDSDNDSSSGSYTGSNPTWRFPNKDA